VKEKVKDASDEKESPEVTKNDESLEEEHKDSDELEASSKQVSET
jgi:hypothetical protein